ncbi:MAG: DsrE family protein [Deltaproteobacteria bacterium]
METNRRKILLTSLVAHFLVFSCISVTSAEQYDAMRGVNNANVIFDMRDGIPKSAAVHVKLIHDTCKQLVAMNKNPVFVVVFIGSAVRLISSNQAEFSAEEQEYLKQIADTISKMSKDGIDFEVCLTAANYFGVDPASILPEIKQVPNGWISEIGYQARGYSLVPVY